MHCKCVIFVISTNMIVSFDPNKQLYNYAITRPSNIKAVASDGCSSSILASLVGDSGEFNLVCSGVNRTVVPCRL